MRNPDKWQPYLVRLPGGDAWEVYLLRVGNSVLVGYEVEHTSPGHGEYRNDHVIVFQRGMALVDKSIPQHVVLLKGAKARMVQEFEIRDESEVVVQCRES